MTGTPEHGQPPDLPQAGGPSDETGAMRPILPDADPARQVEDTPGWSPAPVEPSAVRHGPAYPAPASQPAASATTPSITSFFSSVRRTGRWEVPEVLTVVQGFADSLLDLREAVVRSSTVEIKVYGGFAQIEIIVPPGVAVDLQGGVAFFSEEKATTGELDPAAYRLTVRHYGAFSSVKVITRAVGEEPPKWWKKLF